MKKELPQGVFIDNFACVSCDSSNAMGIYSNDDGTFTGYCRSTCSSDKDMVAFKSNNQLAKSEHASKLGITKVSNRGTRGFRSKPEVEEEVKPKVNRVKNTGKVISKEQLKTIKENTTLDGKGYRGITNEWNRYYGVKTQYNGETGEIQHRFYPATTGSQAKDVKLVGYQRRDIDPKDFRPIGLNSKEIDLFGQFRCRGNGKYLLIAGGQEDVLAAKQMLEGARKETYAPVDVVCSTVGETSAFSQIQSQYDFIDSYDNIVINMDSDAAGQSAVEALLGVLPPNKTKVMDNPEDCKDACDALRLDVADDYVRAFYSARKPKLEGVVHGGEMFQSMIDVAKMPLIPLPPMLRPLQDKLCGGFPLSEIVNILAACVDSDTEFFTGHGWKRIADYKKGGLVGQYNPDGTMTLVEPLGYIKEPCKSMTRISTGGGLDQVMSDGHRFVYWQPHKKDDPAAMKEMYCESLVEEHLAKASGFSRGSVKGFFDYSGLGLDITEGELRLQVAVMADGRIVKGGKDNYTQMRFRKKRKYDRLITLCEQHGLRFSDRGVTAGGEYQVIVWPKLKDKAYDSKYYNCSKDQLSIVLDEMVHWDGSEGTGVFSTTKKESADFIQFAYSSLGVRASISMDSRSSKYLTGYCATVSPTKNGFVGLTKGGEGSGAVVEEYIPKDGYKYCFTVPSGYLVLRRNNRVFITGNSGIGKTLITNNLIQYWILYSPYKVGVLSLEAGAGKFLIRLISGYLGTNVARIATPEEKVQYLNDNRAKCEELFMNEEGEERFCLVDDKGELDTLAAVRRTVERMIRQGDCKLIIIDPIQDILDSLLLEEQAAFLAWQKKVKARDNVTFINVNHTRKSGGGSKAGSQGGMLTEEDMQGTSALYKSAAINIILTRDKTAADEFARNTTDVLLTKSRDVGDTGPAGQLFYVGATARLYNKEAYDRDDLK